MHTPIHLVWIHDRARGTGGAERYLTQVAPALRERGVRSTLLYQPGYSQPEFLAAFDQAWPLLDARMQLHRLQPQAIYLHRKPEGLRLETLQATGIPTLRFYHDHQLFCLREHKYTALGARTCNRPLGTACYTCPGMVVRQGRSLALRTLGPLKAELAVSHKLQAAVVASEYFAGHLRQHGFAPERIHVNPLFAAPVSAAGSPSPWRFLFAGQLVTGKGLDLLLEALVIEPRAELVVAGEGRQAETLRRQVQSLQLCRRVRFLGQVTPAVLADWQSRCCATVIPSRAPETFALTGVESLAAGRPVIATDVGGVRSWLRPGHNGLVVPSGDVRALAAALARLGEAPAYAARLGAQGQVDWETHFRLSHHLDRLVPLLNTLIQEVAA